MNTLKFFLGTAIIALLTSCTTSVPEPKGYSKGYTSARLVNTNAAPNSGGVTELVAVHSSIQRAIRNQFKTRGMTYGSPNADLVVAYLLIGQSPGRTTMNQDYFGNGRDANAIFNEAHQRGVIKNKRPDDFKTGTLVVDIIDAKTNKLVYRGHTTKDLIDVKPIHRDARIHGAVYEILSPFFR